LVGDTIVTWGDRVFGKPPDPTGAKAMLAELSGRTHKVWTGFRLGRFEGGRCVGDSGIRRVESLVTFHKLGRAEIADYVRRDRPLDKAGSYGFQDGALRFVARVEGSYTNIVGLPVFDVIAAAREIGTR
jgi:septum formation protein